MLWTLTMEKDIQNKTNPIENGDEVPEFGAERDDQGEPTSGAHAPTTLSRTRASSSAAEPCGVPLSLSGRHATINNDNTD